MNTPSTQTYTGRMFTPFDPDPADVDIRDIAHALALTCRFGGHCRRFYSVAQHSVHASTLVAPEYSLWALMHDAAEAYVGDVVRPLKRALWASDPQARLCRFEDVECNVLEAIALAFDLPWPLSRECDCEIRVADNRLLVWEARELMAPPPRPWSVTAEPINRTLCAWSPETAERTFLARYEELAVQSAANKLKETVSR
jgi:hypothetical protein